MRRSRRLHARWVIPPASVPAYRRYLTRSRRATQVAYFVVRRDTNELAGVINVSEIVRGNFQSAYLGYYAFTPHAGHGLMREGLTHVIEQAFTKLKLHRLEANIQPANNPSIRLVRSLNFRCEGLSLRYLHIAGGWRDHQRWALLKEDWQHFLTRR
ncbi:MAG TPA: GNAT family N-acetyltransferase [Methylomirabilota bacterium]|nr:GNAT family N-acetyltransferase [Methylomirabilota bacterium]